VYVTSASDPNLRSLLETATSLGRTKVMIQRFVDAWKHGDKRILLLDGEPLGAFLRRPARGGDFRANLSAGGRLERAALTPREKRMAEAMAQRLRDRGLYFTGIDVIGGFLTEINVTSPAGIADLITLERRHAERDVADFIERRAGSVLRRPLPASRPSAGRRRS
jgi:glutathione synthase